MLYNIMKPYFIWTLLVSGLIAVILLCFSIISLYKSGFKAPFIFITASRFFASLASVSLFVSVTAYTLFFLYAAYFSACFFAVSAFVFLMIGILFAKKKGNPFFDRGVNFDAYMDFIGDEYVVIDDYGNDIACSKSEFAAIFKKLKDKGEAESEVLSIGEKHYSVRVSEIIENKKKFGQVFLLSEITEKRQIADSIRQHNSELIKLNAELEKDAAIDSTILFHREREKLTAEIEKLIGENIFKILSFIEKSEFIKEQSKQAENIAHISLQLRNLLADIRKAVNKDN